MVRFLVIISPDKPVPLLSLQLQTKTMERTIPRFILSKMGNYDIEIAGKTVRVDVLDSADLINSRIVNDLFPKLPKESPVVGLDLPSRKKGCCSRSTNSLLVLCIEDYCLVVQLKYVDKIPGILKRFLGDEKICFVGVDVDRKPRGIRSSHSPLVCKTAVELSDLAARIHKKPSLLNSHLEALAKEVDVSWEPATSGGFLAPRVNHKARVFSGDEVKALVYEPYLCYKIGQRLVDSLE